MSKLFVQIGAGKIGRSVMGDLFSSAGYQVLFIDLDEPLVADLARHQAYTIRYHDLGQPAYDKKISDVSAISAHDAPAVIDAIRRADLIGVSVGKSAWPTVIPTLSQGILARSGNPIDVIIVENVSNGAELARTLLTPHMPTDFPWETLGLVSTCIGRMVPSQPPNTERPAWVFAETATQFYGNRPAFVTTPPDCDRFERVDDVAPYVQRKLFLHNMTHCAMAYVTARHSLPATTVADAIKNPVVRRAIEAAANDVFPALASRHSSVFTESELRDYLSAIIHRYGNEKLADKLTRVGRDVQRKLGPNERVVGPIRMLAATERPYTSMLNVFAAAMWFPDPAFGGQRFVDCGRYLTAICGVDCPRLSAELNRIAQEQRIVG